MTIENSEDTAPVDGSVPAAEPPVRHPSFPPVPVVETARESAAQPAEPATSVGVLEVALPVQSDSAPPLSRRLAPPPKPKRDSGMASSIPSPRPPGEAPDLASSSSALKAPIAPTISYAPGAATPTNTPLEPAGSQVASAGPAVPPLSQPPPIPRRRSNPSISGAEQAESVGLLSAEPAPSATETPATAGSSLPRPESHPPPEPSRDAPAASAGPELGASPPSAPAPASAPPASSAIFAMRIIAVGDSVRPPPAAEPVPEIGPDAYPPSASRLGTSVRRSSRPAIAATTASEPEPVPIPPPPALPTDVAASTELDLPIDVGPPIAAADIAAEIAAAAERAQVPPAAPPIVELRPPPPPPPVELGGEPPVAKVAPDSPSEGTTTTAEAEELGREDAISMPPEEVAPLDADLEAKADAAKPPPPPKRAPGAASAAPPVPDAVVPKEPPPTPDPAAAKAAQRSKTRQPWWEDLFNEDFMRASTRVSEAHVRREVTFIEESLGVAPGGIVLDLGCGAGHHAVELASRGYGLVGYDLSLYQLALAADVAQERNQKINFLQGDMREMAFEEMFDGVFCWNTTFGYFEEDKNLAVAQRVFKALRPGGMFLVDVINRDFAAASAPCSVWYEGDSCVCMDDMSVDYISSRLRVKRSIILDDGRTKESLYSLRLYSLHELGKLLHEVGFRVTEASGHPATPGVFFGPNSPRIIMLAQRP